MESEASKEEATKETKQNAKEKVGGMSSNRSRKQVADLGPPFLPAAVADAGAPCGCGRRVKADLWRRHKEPFGPIFSDNTPAEKGAWIQQSVIQTCECGSKVSIPLDPKPPRGILWLYGDEANRETQGYAVECYTLVGGTNGVIRDLVNGLKEAKCKLLPDLDPATWTVHCTKLANRRWRTESERFSDLTEGDVHTFFCNCAQIFKNAQRYSSNTAVFGFRKRMTDQDAERHARKDAKRIAHLALLSSAIFHGTGNGLIPRFFLEAVKEVRHFPHIEGWSRDSFLGSRHYLAHELLCHGNHVPAPEFLAPRSHPLLELADIHAYHLARSLMLQSSGRSPEVPMSMFGEFCYLAMINANRFDLVVEDDVPPKYIPRP
ncbi:hypothetical protein [Bradyrhizobium cenepequi]|uniref:hypothetical protein n=1 Tax=Bradyrhizobium cenepequi TaxID=2821403 RepID=UPI001CE2B011|nr:hypothetical protein [Bradyrhizobium cenepequi]MCA6109785.1 hypothetical protein [Bradyrhizobium cenepequi]